MDKSNNLFFVANNVVQRVDAISGQVTTVAGYITSGDFAGGGYAGNGGPATEAEFCGPFAVAVDANGNLFITDSYNNLIRRVDAVTGIITNVAGSGFGSHCNGNADEYSGGYKGDGGPAIDAELAVPQGIAIDSGGNIYFADNYNNVVRRVDAVTKIITTVAGNGFGAGKCGDSFPVSCPGGFSGDGGLATKAELSSPKALTLDDSDNLYIVDYGNVRIRRVDAKTGIITTVAGNGLSQCVFPTCQEGGDGFGDGGLATQASLEFTYSPGIALDQAGNLYISTLYFLEKVDANTSILTIIAGTTSNDSGPGYGDGGLAIDAYLNQPSGIVFDSQRNLYFADFAAAAIREITAEDLTAAAAPTFSPSPATYVSNQNIKLSSATPGAAIFYTTDGSQPTLLSNQYAEAIPISGAATIRAFATAPNYSDSPLVAGTYAITPPAAEPEFSPRSGTYIASVSVTLTDATPDAAMYYTTNGSPPTTKSTLYEHPLLIDKTTTIEAIALAPGDSASPIATVHVSIQQRAAAPSFSLATGTYHAVRQVTIKESTPNANVYYTTNGSTPISHSTHYKVPITIAKSTTLRAVALATGYASSEVEEAVYTVHLPPQVVIAKPTDVGKTSATLNGSISSEDQATTWWFQYGSASGSLTKETSKKSLAPSQGAVKVSDVLTGLSVDKTTYYQLCATNPGGTACSMKLHFTTP